MIGNFLAKIKLLGEMSNSLVGQETENIEALGGQAQGKVFGFHGIEDLYQRIEADQNEPLDEG